MKLIPGEGFACEIAAVNFFALFNDQRLGKNYIAKYGPEGSRGEFVKEVTFQNQF